MVLADCRGKPVADHFEEQIADGDDRRRLARTIGRES
jgi:hypothetical protein